MGNDIVVAPGSGLAALSDERITAVLDARDMTYGIDDLGEIGTYRDGHLFYYGCTGPQRQHLRAWGRWHRTVAAVHLPQLRRVVEDWDAAAAGPSAYVHTAQDRVTVYAEHTIDCARGVSDDQIHRHLTGAVDAALTLFHRLDARLPVVGPGQLVSPARPAPARYLARPRG